jgi:CelD/BcsL family acetyltransferase involved in cellulose biosynthesis
LQTLLAFKSADEQPESLVAVLPCYIEPNWTRGRVLRLLGDGEVCSDHLGVLSASENVSSAAEGFAACIAERDDWDLIDFRGVDDDDLATTAFLGALAVHDCTTSRLVGERTWAIDLPANWDEFLALQSKSHRKQLRQMERRVLEAGAARWQLVEHMSGFGDAWMTLVDLHQRRRQSLGEPGCFTSTRWAAFHWEVAQQLLREGRLRLSTLELAGLPVAAEYHLAGPHATYAYQGGVDPQRLSDEPGQLSTICSIKRAIVEGHARFDFLRGDEPYKAHWRATPRDAVRWLAVPARLWPRVRHRTFNGVRELACAARQFTGLFS